jgi:hypothetical protein
MELGASEPRKNRGPRRLRKLPGKGTGIRRLFLAKVQVSSQNFLPKTLPPWHQANSSEERRMGQEKGERRKEKGEWRMGKKKNKKKNQEKNERERETQTVFAIWGGRRCFFLRFDADRCSGFLIAVILNGFK